MALENHSLDQTSGEAANDHTGVDSCRTAAGRRSWESGHSGDRRTSTAMCPHFGHPVENSNRLEADIRAKLTERRRTRRPQPFQNPGLARWTRAFGAKLWSLTAWW